MTKPLNATSNTPLVSEDVFVPEIDWETSNFIKLTQPEGTTLDEAKQDVVNNAPSTQQLVEDGYEAQIPPDQLISILESQAEKEGRMLSDVETTYVQMLTVGSPRFSPLLVRQLNNQYAAESMLAEAIKEEYETSSTFSLGLDALDRYLLRHPAMGVFEEATGRLEREADEIYEKSVSLEGKAFKEYFQDKMQSLREEGVLRDGGMFALMELLDATEAKGSAQTQAEKAQFGALAEIGLAGGILVRDAVRLKRTWDRASSITQRIAAVRGKDVAGQTVADAVDKKVADGDTLEDATVQAANLNALSKSDDAIPDVSLATKIERKDGLLADLKRRLKRGDFGRSMSNDEFVALQQRVSQSYSERLTNRLLNFNMPFDSNRVLTATAEVGTTKGKPFANRRTAETQMERLRERGDFDELEGSFDVVEREDGKAVIQFRQNITASEGISPLELNRESANTVRNMLAQVFGSKGQTDDEINNALALAGEAGGNIVQQLVKPLVSKYKKLPTKSRAALDSAYRKLRDDPSLNSLRSNYHRSDMENLLFDELGRLPTDKEIEAIDAIMEMEAIGWYLQADKMLGKYVQWGGKRIEFSYAPNGTIAKRVEQRSNIEELDLVHLPDGKILPYKDVKKEKSLWQLADPITMPDGAEIKYVVKPRDVRELAHHDVLGINSGGRRLMPKAKVFLVNKTKSGAKAFMAGRTEAQAMDAINELKTIQARVKELGGPQAVYGTNLLDDIVLENNRWNANINDTDDFFTWVEDYGIDLDADFVMKERGMPVPDEEAANLRSMGFSNYAEFVSHKSRRADKPILEIGGKGVEDVNAVDSILHSAVNASKQYVQSAWTVRSAVSWVNKARKMPEVDFGGVSPNDFMNAVLNATVTGNTARAREMRHLQNLIKRRMFIPGQFEQAMQRFGDKAIEYVFDKSDGKIDLTGRLSGVDGKILGFNFHSTLGLFNLDQLVVQSAHSLIIMAMDPANGFKAAALIPTLRLTLNMRDPVAAKRMAERMAKYHGLETEEITELLEFLRRNGRTLVTSDAMEHGNPSQFKGTGYIAEGSRLDAAGRAFSRAFDQTVEMGITPFREGEKTSRYTSLVTAWLQWKKLNPERGSSFSEEGLRWIMNKDGALSFNMTTQQSSILQSGPARIPTQWLSYTMRSMEAVAFSRGLTRAERNRLLATQLVMFGGSGIGLSQILGDGVAEGMDVEPGGRIHRLMKWGVVDAILSEITTEPVATATRLSPVMAAVELWDKVWNENTLPETLLGPTYSIPGGMLTSTIDAISAGFRTGSAKGYVTEELLEAFRGIKSLDNAAKAYSIIMTGAYHSKSGGELDAGGMNTIDALNFLFGLKPAEIAFAQQINRSKFKYNKSMREFENELRLRLEKGYDLMLSGDVNDRQYASKLLYQTGQLIDLADYFTAEDRYKMKQRLLGGPGSPLINRLVDMAKYDKFSVEASINVRNDNND